MTNLGQFLSPNRKAPRHPGSKWTRFRKNIFVSFLIDLLVIVGSALVLSLLIKTFLLRSFFVPSGSMLETLQIDDRILVNELVPNLIPIQRGDVVVFKDPGGWLGTISTEPQNPAAAVSDWFLSSFGLIAPDSSQHLVKRVIGIGGVGPGRLALAHGHEQQPHQAFLAVVFLAGAGLATGLVVRDFAANEFEEAVAQIYGGDQQLAIKM